MRELCQGCYKPRNSVRLEQAVTAGFCRSCGWRQCMVSVKLA